MTSTSDPSAWLELLSDKALCKLSGVAVFERGQDYAASGVIESIKTGKSATAEQAVMQAVVHGTQAYQVRVLIDDAHELDAECDCPHARGGNFCKHMVAVCLAWRGLLGGEVPAHDDQAARKIAAAAKRARTQAERGQALQRFVFGQSAEALAQRLWAWAEQDRDCMAELKAWAASGNVGNDAKALRSTLTELLRDRRQYLDWKQSSAYARRAAAALDLVRPWLERDAAMGRELCEHVLLCVYKVAENADDSDGDLGALVDEVQALLLEALRASPPPAAWLDRWFKLMEADPWGSWSESTLLAAAGPAVRARYAERARADWQAWQSSHPRKNDARSRHDTGYDSQREILRSRYLRSIAAEDDPRALLQAMASSAETENDHIELIQLCENQGWHREALQWAQAGVQRQPRSRFCEDALLRCYERDGWDDEALAIHRKRLQEFPDVQAYRATLAAAERAGRDRAAYRAELFAWAEQCEQAEVKVERKRASGRQAVLPNVRTRVQWLMADGELQAALALVQPGRNVCSVQALEALAYKLPKPQEGEAASLLQQVLGTVMDMASSPYARPLELVAEVLKRLPQDQGQAWLQSLRTQYKSKRNFIAGLPSAPA
ncbi:SWIM zinc finger family protein [Comamonas composti]|uniref:SWIM zinc finger family protein n=1 Tax=Comamonas composti TaxID=408558 RepID=UPI0004199D06|nr:SWIM zinc finger family protein [Comamonas composti]